MTKQVFKRLAAVINEMPPTVTKMNVVDAISLVCKEFNPNFDPLKFLSACYERNGSCFKQQTNS